MRILFLIVLYVITHQISAQEVVLERQVIGTIHMDAIYNGTRISGTAGEPVTTTGNSGDRDYTQGFHQPKSPNPLRIFARGVATSCIAMDDGALIIDSITGCVPPYKIEWEFGDSLQKIDNIKAGVYQLTVSTEFCLQTIEVVVNEGPEACPLTFYSAVTPNNDGANDRWEIENIDLSYYADNRVSIYNRAGQEVWNVKGYNNADRSWNGTNSNNKNLPSATYFYVVSINNEVYKGYIELVR